MYTFQNSFIVFGRYGFNTLNEIVYWRKEANKKGNLIIVEIILLLLVFFL